VNTIEYTKMLTEILWLTTLKKTKVNEDTINLTDKAGAKTAWLSGVAATKRNGIERKPGPAFGGNVILEKYQDGGSNWEVLPEAQDGKITLDEFRPKKVC
jgi:hypothetical protein